MSMLDELVVWGALGHARVVIDAIRCQGRYSVVALIDDRDPAIRPAELDGVPVYGGREALGDLHRGGARHLIVAFGNCAARLGATEHALTCGFELATVVHPKSTVAGGATLGDGTFVAAGAIINPGAEIGRAVIVNTMASIDHDCRIADGAHICPGVVLAGSVRIGRESWIGVGSVVSNDITIGARTTVGAGSVVVRDLPDGVVAYGCPAVVRDG